MSTIHKQILQSHFGNCMFYNNYMEQDYIEEDTVSVTYVIYNNYKKFYQKGIKMGI